MEGASATQTRIRPGSRAVQLLAVIRTVLDGMDLPLTAPGRPSRTDPNGWSYGYSPEIDRTSLAWATAYRMLADHQPDAEPLSHVYAADAVLRELGTAGLAILQSNLVGGAPIDFRYTPCPYCGGGGEDPTAACEDLGCSVHVDIADHLHGCPVCRAEVFEPELTAEQEMRRIDELLAEALPPAKPRWLRARLHPGR
jgi:hypothetical protein